MKRVFLIILLLIMLSSSAFAIKSFTGQRVIIDQAVQDNAIVTGQDLRISSNIEGDLTCAGGMVIIDGSVKDDITCAAGTISISKQVSDNVKILAGNVEISAKITGDLIIAGGNVRILDSAVVGGDLLIMGGNVEYLGTTVGNANIKAGTIVFGGIVGKSAFLTGNKIILEKGTVEGDLTYASRNSVDTSKLTVNGQIFKQVLPSRAASFRTSLAGRILAFVALFIVGSLIILIMPKYARMVGKTVSGKFWASVGIGMLVLILAPIAMILFLVTVIGIPLAVILLFSYIVLIYISKLATAYWLSSTAGAERPWPMVLTAGISLLIIYAFLAIPIVGAVLNVILIIIGTGAMSIACYQLLKQARKSR
ncbi:MAG: polymer-forming cytoskeletal protein [Candidatus Woesearchaeota archaeon]